MPRTKPPAKEITKAKDAARRHHKTPGEKRAIAPRPILTPTKKRPAGETSLTRNVELEKPPSPATNRPTRKKPENLRVGKRTPKRAKKIIRARSSKKD